MYTQEQIELTDKAFNYIIERYINRTEKDNPTSILFAKMFSVDRSAAQNAINNICSIGQELGILTAQQLDDGNYEIVRMNKTKSTNFKYDGGFKKYFNELKKEGREKQVQVAISDTRINYENVQLQVSNFDATRSNITFSQDDAQSQAEEISSQPSYASNEINKNVNLNNPPKKKMSLLEKLSWTIGIVAGLICIYEFVIKKFLLHH